MIEVRYLCSCLGDEVKVQVRERLEAEDVAYWVGQVVAGVISEDHRQRSPGCPAQKVTHVKIPLPENAPFLGGAPRLDS